MQPYAANHRTGLPLQSTEDALRAAILTRLKLDKPGLDAELKAFTIFKRSYDARKKTAIVLIYTVDCEVEHEAELLARLKGDPHIRARPIPAIASSAMRRRLLCGEPRPRPLVVGFGLRHLCSADTGADGLASYRARTRSRGARAHQGHLGLWRQGQLNPESNVQFGEGGAGTFSTASCGARSATRAI